MPKLSTHALGREPSPIRRAQIQFGNRPDAATLECVNVSIGNISLPMHPAMRARAAQLMEGSSPFAEGVVGYAPTKGLPETQDAFLQILRSFDVDTSGLGVIVTDGGSMAMELMVLACCGPNAERPLAVLDPAYSNYISMADRCGAKVVSLQRPMTAEQRFALPDFDSLEDLFARTRPAALVVIGADNPTGQALGMGEMRKLAELCVKHDAWMVSDEAYRGLRYDGESVSVWHLGDGEVPGIEGRRISIESSSKVFNACGLRIGALVSDHPELVRRSVNELTANLSSNSIGQWIFGALAHQSVEELRDWYESQRNYYRPLMKDVVGELRERIPKALVSEPQASLYTVVDLAGAAGPSFDALEFVEYCATRGRVEIEDQAYTLLSSPMGGFYTDPSLGKAQLRVAFVEEPERMRLVPRLMESLLKAYLSDQDSR